MQHTRFPYHTCHVLEFSASIFLYDVRLVHVYIEGLDILVSRSYGTAQVSIGIDCSGFQVHGLLDPHEGLRDNPSSGDHGSGALTPIGSWQLIWKSGERDGYGHNIATQNQHFWLYCKLENCPFQKRSPRFIANLPTIFEYLMHTINGHSANS